MANLGSLDNDTVEIGGRVDYKLAGCVHAKVEPEEMFFGSWWLIINLIRVWLIKLDGEKRSKSFAVLAAFSSSSLLCSFFFFFFLAISSSASLEMPLNGLPRSMERKELKQKR